MSEDALMNLIHRASVLLPTDPEQALQDLLGFQKTYEENSLYLQTLGEAYLENSNVENAYSVLSKACELDPIAQNGIEKFFHLGQIVGGENGVQLLEVGIARLINQAQILQSLSTGEIQADENLDTSVQILLQAYGSEEKINEYIISKLTQGIAAIIEIWMTDLCMQPQAEEECEKWAKSLLEMCFDNPETHSIIASIRISQQMTESAIEEIKTSWQLFQKKKQALEDIANTNENIDPDEIEMMYIEMYQPLVTLAKYAIECGLFELAAEIASSARDINEDGVEALYVEGFANYLEALRIQNNFNDEKSIELGREFESFSLNKDISNTDPSFEFINNSRLALSSAVKSLHNRDLAAQIDDELKNIINELLEKVGGFLSKEKDVSGIDETNWENEILENEN
jgi:tetratricopeptide (TPR) repeat protein